MKKEETQKNKDTYKKENKQSIRASEEEICFYIGYWNIRMILDESKTH